MVTDNLPPVFVADAAGLDFLNSLAIPVDKQVEWIGNGEDLLKWLEAAQFVSPTVLESMRQKAVPGELDGIAAQARSLREWFREFVQKHKGRSLPVEALTELEPLNRVLARDDKYSEIEVGSAEPTEGGLALKWAQRRRWRSPDALLLPIAEAMGQLVCEEEFGKIKACEGNNCTILFLDRSKSGKRRWCSMAVCGNRAKQAAQRRRAQ